MRTMQTTARRETARRAGRSRKPSPAGDAAAASPRPAPGSSAPRPPGGQALSSLRPLAIDVGIPLGSYYLLHDGLGASLWLSLALSSVGPAIRSVWSMAREGEPNLLAGLMLAVNVAGIAVSFLTGNPRVMIAKDSVVSSVLAFAILGSVAARRPLMSVGLKVYLTRGTRDRVAAWDRLSQRCQRFRRLELTFSGIWGTALLAECGARLIGAYSLPVATMAWLGTVFTLGAIGLAIVAGSVVAAPMAVMIEREMAGPDAAAD
jgi:hypothetical protein